MLYEKNLLDKWTEYSVLKTAKERALEEGMKEGTKTAKEEVVNNLIIKLGFTDEQVADIAGVSIDFVKKIRTSLKRKKRKR